MWCIDFYRYTCLFYTHTHTHTHNPYGPNLTTNLDLTLDKKCIIMNIAFIIGHIVFLHFQL